MGMQNNDAHMSPELTAMDVHLQVWQRRKLTTLLCAWHAQLPALDLHSGAGLIVVRGHSGAGHKGVKAEEWLGGSGVDGLGWVIERYTGGAPPCKLGRVQNPARATQADTDLIVQGKTGPPCISRCLLTHETW